MDSRHDWYNEEKVVSYIHSPPRKTFRRSGQNASAFLYKRRSTLENDVRKCAVRIRKNLLITCGGARILQT